MVDVDRSGGPILDEKRDAEERDDGMGVDRLASVESRVDARVGRADGMAVRDDPLDDGTRDRLGLVLAPGLQVPRDAHGEPAGDRIGEEDHPALGVEPLERQVDDVREDGREVARGVDDARDLVEPDDAEAERGGSAHLGRGLRRDPLEDAARPLELPQRADPLEEARGGAEPGGCAHLLERPHAPLVVAASEVVDGADVGEGADGVLEEAVGLERLPRVVRFAGLKALDPRKGVAVAEPVRDLHRLCRLPLAPLHLAHPEGQLGGVGEGAAEAVGGAPFGEGLEDLVEVPACLVEPLAVALEERERQENRCHERRLAGAAGRVERVEKRALRPVEVAPLAQQVPERRPGIDGGVPVAVAEEVEGEAVARLRLVPAPEDFVAGPEADGRLRLPEGRPQAAVDLERPLEAASRRGVVAPAALERRAVRERGGDAPEVAGTLGLLEALPLHRLALLPASGPGEDGREGRERAADEVAPLAPAGGVYGGREPLLCRGVVAALESDRPERAEQERPQIVGQLGTRERQGGFGLRLGAVGITTLESRAGGRIEKAGLLLGRSDGAELSFGAVEERARGLHVSPAQADHPDLERQEGRVAPDPGVVGVGADGQLLEEEVVRRERPAPVARTEVDVAEPLADRRLLGGPPREVEKLEDAAVGLRRLVVGEEPLGPCRRGEAQADGPLGVASSERVERGGREEVRTPGEAFLEVRGGRIVQEAALLVGQRGRQVLARPGQCELPDRLARELPLPEKSGECERAEGIGEGVGLAHGATRTLAEGDRREAQRQLERQVGRGDGEGREELAPGGRERRQAGVGPLGGSPGTGEAAVQAGVDDELTVSQRDGALLDELLEERDQRSRPALALVVDEPRQLLGQVLPAERAGGRARGLPLGERSQRPGREDEILERREGVVRVGPRLGRSGRLGRRGDEQGPGLGRFEEKREKRRGGAVGEVKVVDENDERPLSGLGATRRFEGGENLVEQGEAARLLGDPRDGRRVGIGRGEARDPGERGARGSACRSAASREGREDVEDGPVGRPVLGDGPPFDDEGPFRLRQRTPLGEEA